MKFQISSSIRLDKSLIDEEISKYFTKSRPWPVSACPGTRGGGAGGAEWGGAPRRAAFACVLFCAAAGRSALRAFPGLPLLPAPDGAAGSQGAAGGREERSRRCRAGGVWVPLPARAASCMPPCSRAVLRVRLSSSLSGSSQLEVA